MSGFWVDRSRSTSTKRDTRANTYRGVRKDPVREIAKPKVYMARFCKLTGICCSLFRNFYIYYGYIMALEIRKLLISALYDKLNKLSMRSLTETNQSRLI